MKYLLIALAALLGFSGSNMLGSSSSTVVTDDDGYLHLTKFRVVDPDDTWRFIVPATAVGSGTYSPRSFIIAGPTTNDLVDVECATWGFNFIDCNTDATGADLGVQDDLEVLGTASTSQLFVGTTTAGLAAFSASGELYSTGSMGGGSGSPGGSTGQLQYNNAGAFGGAAGLVWDSANSRLGFGTTSPWAQVAIATTTSDPAVPVLSISGDSDPQNQLLTIIASSTGNALGITRSVAQGNARAIFGPIVGSFATLFTNGPIASSWDNRVCDNFNFLAQIAADTNFICGFIYFNETTAATLNLVTTDTNGHLATALAVASGITADSGELVLDSVIGTGIGTTTPVLEVTTGSFATVSSTTSTVIGFNNSLVSPTFGCYVIATSTPNYQALCQTSGAAITQVNTGIATSTTNVKWRMELGSSGFVVRAKTSIFGFFAPPVATITTNLPTTGTVMQTRIGVRRLVNGTAIAPALTIYSIRYFKQSPWNWADLSL